MILNKFQIKQRIESNPAMVSNIKDLNHQLQPAGLDLTVSRVFKWESAGCLDFDNSGRYLSEKTEVKPLFNGKITYDKYYLEQGCYQIELNEVFNIPTDVLGFNVPRSSSQRCGVSILQGYFEPGFIGKGYSLLVVYNPKGFYLYKDAKICQMIFHLTESTEGYNGIYQEKDNK